MNGKEMNEIKLNNFIWMFSNKRMQMNSNEWNVFGSNIKGNEWNHFMKILLLDPYFEIKSWIYRGILGVLVKKIIKSNFIRSNSS